MDKVYGYWIETAAAIYFVRDGRDALPEHKEAFTQAQEDITITPVTKIQDVAKWVVLRHLKKGVIFFVGWSPELHVPIEHDHTGKVAYEVLDFAESIEEANAVVNQLKTQK